MPVKPLPKKLVNRLIKLVGRRTRVHGETDVYSSIGKMKNIDHRQNLALAEGALRKDTGRWGMRVREMNVSRNYPGVELVIKRVHGENARYVVQKVLSFVRNHNTYFNPEQYVLLAPHVYPIGENLVAMAKADYPCIEEILGSDKSGSDKSRRGEKFFSELKDKFGVKEGELKSASDELMNRVNYPPISSAIFLTSNKILVLGYRNGKFIFMPLIDLY